MCVGFINYGRYSNALINNNIVKFKKDICQNLPFHYQSQNFSKIGKTNAEKTTLTIVEKEELECRNKNNCERINAFEEEQQMQYVFHLKLNFIMLLLLLKLYPMYLMKLVLFI